MIYSQGIGPLSNAKNRKRVRRVFNRCAILTVRDNQSAAFLKELGIKKDVYVVSDPVMAFCREDIDIDEIKGLMHEIGIPDGMGVALKPLLFVAVRNWSYDEHIAPIAELLDTQTLAGWDVLLVPAHFPQDLEACEKLKKLMSTDAYCVEKCLTARQFLTLASRADKVLSMRLHGLICAMAMETPMMGLSYDPKVDGFMEQAGLGRFCIPYNSRDLIASRALLQELDAMTPDSKHEFSERRDEMHEIAWETARKALDLLRGQTQH